MKKFLSHLIATFILTLVVASPASASLWQYFNDRGQELPSLNERAVTAAEFGIWNYEGTVEQNNLLEERLKFLDPKENEEDLLGFAVVTRYRTRLASSMTSTQATVPVSSVTSFDGTVLTMALLDGVVFFTLEPGTSREEIVKCTTLSGTTWGTCIRGLAFTGKTETAVTANQNAHNAGSIVVMSNVHFVFNQLVDLDTTETITGQKTYTVVQFFDVLPEISTTLTATTSNQLVPFQQLNAVVNQGAATSSPTTAGISQQSTPLQNASSTQFDTDNPHVINSENASSTPSAFGCDGTANGGALCVIVSKLSGKISQLWIDLTEAFTWTGSHTFNTGTVTFGSNATSTSNFEFTSQVENTGRAIGFYPSRDYKCGETISADVPVYSSSTPAFGATVFRADASLASTTVPFIGFTKESCTISSTSTVQVGGIFEDTSASFTIDDIMFISDTVGTIQNTAGTVDGIVGRIISGTEIFMDIDKGWQFIEDVTDTSDVINVKPWARYATVRITGTGTVPGQCQGHVTITRTGLTTATIIQQQDGTGSNACNAIATWAANTITLTETSDNTNVSGTASFYY